MHDPQHSPDHVKFAFYTASPVAFLTKSASKSGPVSGIVAQGPVAAVGRGGGVEGRLTLAPACPYPAKAVHYSCKELRVRLACSLM